jgi:hypothetical protein
LKSVVLLSLPLGGASHGDLRAAESAVTALPPFAEPLQWTASDALVMPALIRTTFSSCFKGVIPRSTRATRNCPTGSDCSGEFPPAILVT